MSRALLAAAGFLLGGDAHARTPLFDVHLHYSAVDAAALSPAGILGILDAGGIERAVVSGTPTAFFEALYNHAPTRIVPFLSVYEGHATKATWVHDSDLIARVKCALGAGIYRGIGELHLFAPDRHQPAFRALVVLAADRGLVLQIHGDAAVIDAVFETEPNSVVIWAHLGTQPYPDVLRQMLARHPRGLYLDTSVRDERFVDDGGHLLPEWRQFFTEHADRVLVGVDTYWTRRWRELETETAQIRGWLDQLPNGVAERIGYLNARTLFAKPGPSAYRRGRGPAKLPEPVPAP